MADRRDHAARYAMAGRKEEPACYGMADRKEGPACYAMAGRKNRTAYCAVETADRPEGRRPAAGQTGKRRLSRAGFTLTEVLATVALVGIMSLAVTSGLGAAMRAYHSVRLRADAETLLATAVSAMTLDMSSAYQITPAGNGSGQVQVASFYSDYRGYRMAYQNSKPDGIQVAYVDGSSAGAGGTGGGAASGSTLIPLLTESTQTLGLYVRIGNNDETPQITYDEKTHCFVFDLQVVNSEDDKVLAESKQIYTHSAELD